MAIRDPTHGGGAHKTLDNSSAPESRGRGALGGLVRQIGAEAFDGLGLNKKSGSVCGVSPGALARGSKAMEGADHEALGEACSEGEDQQ